jgi:hypothetical protein
MIDSEIAYYLYCLTPCGRGIQTSAIGVDGQHPVFVGACGEIGAVLSEVGRGEFCGDAAEANLQDLAWLGPRVCRHEAAIEEVMRQSPILPARFATMFTCIDSLEQSVLQHRKAIAGFFVQIGDKQEWAVKGILNRTDALERLGSSGRPAALERAAVDSPGARYFQEKRIKAQWERDFNFHLKEFCRRAAAALGANAETFRERKVPAPATAGTDAEVVLNWAFLFSPADLDEFRGRLERLNGTEAFPGLALTLTGPWPPYSFVSDLSFGATA